MSSGARFREIGHLVLEGQALPLRRPEVSTQIEVHPCRGTGDAVQIETRIANAQRSDRYFRCLGQFDVAETARLEFGSHEGAVGTLVRHPGNQTLQHLQPLRRQQQPCDRSRQSLIASI